MFRAWLFLSHLVLVVPAVSATSAAPRSTLLEGSAPTILSGLASHWAVDFGTSQAAVKVDVPAPYDPPQGRLSLRLSAFLAGKLDFALLTRTISDSDLAAFRRAHGYDPLVIPVAGGSWNGFGYVDPVVVIVNARNPIGGLTFSELDAMFSKSRLRGHHPIRRWHELGVVAFRNDPIHLAGGASWSGEDSARASVFRGRVMLGGAWRDDPQAQSSGTEQDVPARVAADPLAIGFTGNGHVIPGTRVVPLAADRRYVAPIRETVVSASYPLVRTVDLLVARAPGTCLSPALRQFVDYLLSTRGQKLIAREGHFLRLTRMQSRQSRLLASSCS